MPRITEAVVTTVDGAAVKADCFGNNAAVLCPKCNERPVLLTALRNQRGSDEGHRASCACGASVWITTPLADEHDALQIEFR